jgi:hypothetical protein
VTISAQGSQYVGGIVATSGDYAGLVTLACTVTYTGTGTVNDVPGCTVSPSSFTLIANGTATGVVYLTTTPITYTENIAHPVLMIGSGGVLACLLICIPLRRRRIQLPLLLLALFFAAAGISGCGGNTTIVPGTTVGNYSITVTGTYSGSTSTSTTFTLTVN